MDGRIQLTLDVLDRNSVVYSKDARLRLPKDRLDVAFNDTRTYGSNLTVTDSFLAFKDMWNQTLVANKTNKIVLNSTVMHLWDAHDDMFTVIIANASNSSRPLMCNVSSCNVSLSLGDWYYALAGSRNTSLTLSVADKWSSLMLNTTFDFRNMTVLREDFVRGSGESQFKLVGNYSYNMREQTTNEMTVQDLTGNNILHLDLRLQNVGELRHKVNFTGFVDSNNVWTFGRSIDDEKFLI